MMTIQTAAVCPHCGSPALEERVEDVDIYHAMVAFERGEPEAPRLYRWEWIKGWDEEEIAGCLDCGARFDEDGAQAAAVDLDSADAEIARRAIDDRACYSTEAPSHIGICRECGADTFIAGLTRWRTFAALYRSEPDGVDLWDHVVVSASAEFDSVRCDHCESEWSAEELWIHELGPHVHLDQLQLDLGDTPAE